MAMKIHKRFAIEDDFWLIPWMSERRMWSTISGLIVENISDMVFAFGDMEY
jgi:hypothetical protein